MPTQQEVSKVTKGYERLGVLILDGSGSMREQHPSGQTKAEAINSTVKEFITALKNHPEEPNLFLSIITYDEDVSLNIPPTPVSNFDPNGDYNPLDGHGGMTAIGDALEKGFEVAYNFLKESSGYPRYAIIILMTDGKNTTGNDPIEVSNKIHQRVREAELGKKFRRICALGFGDPNDKESLDVDTLKAIVSEDKWYLQTMDPNEIVSFFLSTVLNK